LYCRYLWFVSWQGDPQLKNNVGEKVELEGVIVEEPVKKESYTQLIVLINTFIVENFSQEIQPTKILVYDDAYSKRNYGDKVTLKGKLLKPENFEGDAGREFNYVQYLAKDKIFFLIKYASVSLVSENNGNKVKTFVLKLKNNFVRSLDNGIAFPESRLAAGIIVAGKQSLPKTIQDEFQETGTIQVVVLSGYNVTIIAEMMMALLRMLPQMLGLSLGALSIFLFTIATGGSATIIRAVIMALIALFAQGIDKRYNAGRALLVAALLMLFFNPMLLFFDPSFQLSFLATAGLIYATPVAERWLVRIPEKMKLREVVASTLATQIFVTPFLMYLTGAASIVALPANIFLSFLIPVAMLLSFVTGLLGTVSWFFAWPVGFLAFVILKIILTLVHFFSLLPFASVSFVAFPFWVLMLVYIGFTYYLVKFYTRKKQA
jgi:competence protein ComEC